MSALVSPLGMADDDESGLSHQVWGPPHDRLGFNRAVPRTMSAIHSRLRKAALPLSAQLGYWPSDSESLRCAHQSRSATIGRFPKPATVSASDSDHLGSTGAERLSTLIIG